MRTERCAVSGRPVLGTARPSAPAMLVALVTGTCHASPGTKLPPPLRDPRCPGGRSRLVASRLRFPCASRRHLAGGVTQTPAARIQPGRLHPAASFPRPQRPPGAAGGPAGCGPRWCWGGGRRSRSWRRELPVLARRKGTFSSLST